MYVKDAEDYEPVISEKTKKYAYFLTDLGVLACAFVAVVLTSLEVGRPDVVVVICTGLETMLMGIKSTFRISGKK